MAWCYPIKMVQDKVTEILYLQSRRLDMATATFLWPEQRCKIHCIFCYLRLPWGNSNVPLARATLPELKIALGCPVLS